MINNLRGGKMAELANCPNCNKVFVKAFRPVCEACHREVEEKFDIVSKFIRKKENRMATIEEVHAKTEVEKDLIFQFIREGRLHLSHFPNLGYPCEKCGEQIREGRLCKNCLHGIKSDLKALEQEQAFEKRKEEAEKAKNRTYHLLNNRLKNRED